MAIIIPKLNFSRCWMLDVGFMYGYAGTIISYYFTFLNGYNSAKKWPKRKPNFHGMKPSLSIKEILSFLP